MATRHQQVVDVCRVTPDGFTSQAAAPIKKILRYLRWIHSQAAAPIKKNSGNVWATTLALLALAAPVDVGWAAHRRPICILSFKVHNGEPCFLC